MAAPGSIAVAHQSNAGSSEFADHKPIIRPILKWTTIHF
jgi:hypothetical protein